MRTYVRRQIDTPINMYIMTDGHLYVHTHIHCSTSMQLILRTSCHSLWQYSFSCFCPVVAGRCIRATGPGTALARLAGDDLKSFPSLKRSRRSIALHDLSSRVGNLYRVWVAITPSGEVFAKAGRTAKATEVAKKIGLRVSACLKPEVHQCKQTWRLGPDET